MSEVCCTRLPENTGCKKSPSRYHCTTLLGHVFATKAYIDNLKNLLNTNTSSTCPHNMVNFGSITAENTARYSSSKRQPNFVALNRGHHLYSAGRPSCWALAHILVNVNSRSHSLFTFVERELTFTFAICCRPYICLSSICLSCVTLVHPTQAVVIFGNLSTAFGTLTIRWHARKILWRSSQWNPSVGGVKPKRWSKI